MAINYLDEMRNAIWNQSAQTPYRGVKSMYDITPAGDGGAAQRATDALKRRQLMDLEEWNNRQKLYDPATWMSAFGGSTAPATPSVYDTKLSGLMSDPNSIANSAAYKFRLDQGNQAIQRSAAAKGMLGSGNTLAELLKYGQGEASQEYGNEVGRLTTLRGQDLNLQAMREKANLDARNNFLGMLMQRAFQAPQPIAPFYSSSKLQSTGYTNNGYGEDPFAASDAAKEKAAKEKAALAGRSWV